MLSSSHWPKVSRNLLDAGCCFGISIIHLVIDILKNGTYNVSRIPHEAPAATCVYHSSIDVHGILMDFDGDYVEKLGLCKPVSPSIALQNLKADYGTPWPVQLWQSFEKICVNCSALRWPQRCTALQCYIVLDGHIQLKQDHSGRSLSAKATCPSARIAANASSLARTCFHQNNCPKLQLISEIESQQMHNQRPGHAVNSSNNLGQRSCHHHDLRFSRQHQSRSIFQDCSGS